jgi:hypothetical protein
VFRTDSRNPRRTLPRGRLPVSQFGGASSYNTLRAAECHADDCSHRHALQASKTAMPSSRADPPAARHNRSELGQADWSRSSGRRFHTPGRSTVANPLAPRAAPVGPGRDSPVVPSLFAPESSFCALCHRAIHMSTRTGVGVGPGVGLPELVNDLLADGMFPFHRESPPPAAATRQPSATKLLQIDLALNMEEQFILARITSDEVVPNVHQNIPPSQSF